METADKNRKQNKLLKREEITLTVTSGTTPRTEELKKEIAGKFNSSEEAVVIKSIRGTFGRKDFDVEAYIYDNKEALAKYEPKQKANKETKQESAEQAKPENAKEGK